MDQGSFCWGFVAGAVLFGGAGYIAQQIMLAQKRAKMAEMKQPVPALIGMTPSETVRMSRRARLNVALWVMALIALVACIGFFVVQAL